MQHGFIDRYSDLDSLIHRLDPRTKLIAILTFIIMVVATPPTRWQAFACYLALITALLLLSKLPISFVLRRSLVVIPFVVLIAIFIPFFAGGETAGSYNIWIWQVSVTHNGLLILWNVLIKAWLSILSLIILTATTGLASLLKGLEQLRFPRTMIMILSFMYRYIFVTIDEVMRMQRARDSRSLGASRVRQIKTVGNMIGTLFIRSYERGERVYQAMAARGYDGQARALAELRLARQDTYFAVAFGLALAIIGFMTLL